MTSIECSLYHLQHCVSDFVLPPAALRDVRMLKAQIELRRLALRDIEVIRCRLQPHIRSKRRRLRRQLPIRSAGRYRPIAARI
jgi:hypothetical protein